MAGVNKVILIGNLGRDPEVRYAQNGTAIAKLNLAIGERKKEGDEWIEHTEWVRVTCFGRTAENVGQYVSKGSQIYVEGRMQTSKYTDRDGTEKWSTEVVANNVTFLGGRGGNRDNGNNGPQNGQGDGFGNGGRDPQRRDNPQNSNNASPNREAVSQSDGFFEDDLPF